MKFIENVLRMKDFKAYYATPVSDWNILFEETYTLLPETMESADVDVQIFLDSAMQARGACKFANPGELSFHDNSQFEWTKLFDGQVCVKRMREIKGLKMTQTDERNAILIELRCLVWGNGLLVTVYHFMRAEEEARDEQPPSDLFVTPTLSYVQAAMIFGLFEGKSQSLLVEEMIPTDDSTPKGKFVKYIHNVDPRPSEDVHTPEQETKAMFLGFTQHCQYDMTSGLAFTSDLQGTVVVMIMC
jgi:hypothetical protein